MSRFDYVKYDIESQDKQAQLKASAQKVEACMEALDVAQIEMRNLIDDLIEGDRARGLANLELSEACLAEDCYDRLEMAYAWCGKGIRDDQIARKGGAELQEERGHE